MRKRGKGMGGGKELKKNFHLIHLSYSCKIIHRDSSRFDRVRIASKNL